MSWWVSLISYLSVFSAVPAIWLGRKQQGLLWYYAWASFLSDIIPFVQRRLSGSVWYVQGNLFYLCELILVGLFFIREIPSRLWRRVVLGVIVLIAAFFLVRAWPHINTEVNWPDVVFGSFALMLLCIAALFKVIRNVEHLKIEQSPLFVFSACFLLYVAYSLLLMLFTEQFKQAPKSLRLNIWSVHNVLNSLKNLAIARVFTMRRKAALS